MKISFIDSCNITFLRHILQSGARPERIPGPSEKADPGALEKVDNMPKFNIMIHNSSFIIHNHIFEKLQGADFKYDNSFS